MRVSYFLVLTIIAVASTTVSGYCGKIIKCFDNILNGKLNRQIAVQLKGQYTFLYLAQLYDRDTTFYNEIANFFRKKADEHLKHAQTFMKYQNQRGGTVEMGGQYAVDLYTENACGDIQSLAGAFQCAMQLQGNITSELAELRDDALGITIDNTALKCSDAGTRLEELTDADNLLLTQSLLVSCQLAQGGENIVTANWRRCTCESIKSVSYGELAKMIGVDFLKNQSEDRKEISNYFQTLKKTDSCTCTRGITGFLLDVSLTPPPPEDE